MVEDSVFLTIEIIKSRNVVLAPMAKSREEYRLKGSIANTNLGILLSAAKTLNALNALMV